MSSITTRKQPMSVGTFIARILGETAIIGTALGLLRLAIGSI